ncbi:isoprenoid synthase domain-containing protein [Entophlyctis helioformis]|nr:isoprenoid synthase domain-containing protein [Entophlyctis helioformis]
MIARSLRQSTGLAGAARGSHAAMLQSRRLLSTAEADKYCMDLVRTHDYENYLANIFTPSRSRAAAVAIRAFNVETAQIRDIVSEPNIGKMRIQWWRDGIDKTFKGSPPSHPVMQTIARTLETTRLSQTWFKKILNAREAYMQDKQYDTIAELEDYAENTSSSVTYLHLEALGLQNVHAEHAASHIGKAIGICIAIRATPFDVSRRKFHLPAEVMAQHSVVTEEVFRNGPSTELTDAIFTIATRANDQLLTARSFAKDVPKQAVPALLPLIACEHYLKALEKANFNVFDPELQKKSLALPFKLWTSARQSKY